MAAVSAGFAAKACIHPSQAAVVREAFRPTPEQIRWAREVTAAADHVELDSARVGARLGIWVTKPPTYAQGNQQYPVVYVTDGNAQAALTAPLSHAMTLKLSGSRSVRSRSWAARRSTPTSCSSTTLRSVTTRLSARSAAGSTTCQTGSTPSGSWSDGGGRPWLCGPGTGDQVRQRACRLRLSDQQEPGVPEVCVACELRRRAWVGRKT
jgi:hypothetical protein